MRDDGGVWVESSPIEIDWGMCPLLRKIGDRHGWLRPARGARGHEWDRQDPHELHVRVWNIRGGAKFALSFTA